MKHTCLETHVACYVTGSSLSSCTYRYRFSNNSNGTLSDEKVAKKVVLLFHLVDNTTGVNGSLVQTSKELSLEKLENVGWQFEDRKVVSAMIIDT